MGKQIRILMVEDSEDDTALLVREIKRGGYDLIYERVETRKGMEEALNNLKWDAVICDYVMPKFSMPDAFKILKKRGLDLPFILVSGTVGEDVAVEAMKAGAHDYIMKDRLARLVPAIEREIREAEKRRKIKHMEDAIQALIKSMVGVTGQDFFDRIVINICEWLDVDGAFIGSIPEGGSIEMLAMQLDGRKTSDFEYNLKGTPCEEVLNKGYCVYNKNVSESFPDDKVLSEMNIEGYAGIPLKDKNGKPNGIFWAVSRRGLNLPPQAGEVMDIIAAKAGSEIERIRSEAQIMASLKEKEVLLKEIHHRVKNNLQVISSLLNLQSKYITDERVLSVFRESQNRVKSMALVHEELYQSRDLAKIDFSEYVRNLISFLFRSYGANSNFIITKINIDDIMMSIDSAIPCGLIINELVSNSLKYAFQTCAKVEEDRGEIKISLHKIGNSSPKTPNAKSKIELIVSDNGDGFPKEIDFKNTESLGLQLVNTLTEQLDGTIEFNGAGGAEFKIKFEC